ncbi:MAG: tetratricopeptide repeat protein [Nitrospirota bacterium]
MFRPVCSLLLLVALIGCHEPPQPLSALEPVTPIVPPFASGLVGEPAALDPSAMDAMALIKSYQDRLDRNPQDLEALVFLGNASYDIKRYDEAESMYRRALAIDPELVQVRTDLATALHRQGRSQEAIEELQRVLVVDYRHETALYNLGLLKLNVLGDHNGAIATWEQLLEATEDAELKAKVQGMIDTVRHARPQAALSPAGPS